MKIFVHDYPGHAFPLQLSRWLAAQGHEVVYAYSTAFLSPRGDLDGQNPATLRILALHGKRPVRKYDVVRRWLQQRGYAAKLCAALRAFKPDVVLAGNSSPDIQDRLRRASRAADARFMSWVQDIHAVMLRRILKKYPLIGGVAARYAEWVEYRNMRLSDAVVVISEDFTPMLVQHGVPDSLITVIENWAPLEDIPTRDRDNDWARKHGLQDRFVFLYSGTLGLKHNPDLLLRLAAHFRDRSDVAVFVITEGPVRAYLAEAKQRDGLNNLTLLDFQPFPVLPDVLATADVLVVILEPLAGILSVPSKILSYLCAGRPILAAVPSANLAARTLARAEAGECAEPGDPDGFLAAADRLLGDAERRSHMASSARSYAESAFDIDRIGQRFLNLMQSDK